MGIGFAWDRAKAVGNRRKHGISFEEAATAFFDDHALIIPDPADLGAKSDETRSQAIRDEVDAMRKEYDFGEATQSPYAKRLKRSVTIRLETETIRYFKKLSRTTGLPYQTLINLYLRDCALTGREPRVRWGAATRASNPVARKSTRG